MISIHIDPKLESWVNAMKLGVLAFKTFGLHRSAPYWGYAAIRRAELRSPSRPKARLS